MSIKRTTKVAAKKTAKAAKTKSAPAETVKIDAGTAEPSGEPDPAVESETPEVQTPAAEGAAPEAQTPDPEVKSEAPVAGPAKKAAKKVTKDLPEQVTELLAARFDSLVVAEWQPKVLAAVESGRIVTITKPADQLVITIHKDLYYRDRDSVRGLSSQYGDTLVEVINQKTAAKNS